MNANITLPDVPKKLVFAEHFPDHIVKQLLVHMVRTGQITFYMNEEDIPKSVKPWVRCEG